MIQNRKIDPKVKNECKNSSSLKGKVISCQQAV